MREFLIFPLLNLIGQSQENIYAYTYTYTCTCMQKLKMSMRPLSGETVRLLSSSQVITSAHVAVKELVENALDAKASNIEVRLVGASCCR